MLNISNPEKLSPRFFQLLADFRRTQVSRFPIKVEVINTEFMVFVDSRFPLNAKVIPTTCVIVLAQFTQR
jgi:hypothetical protein